MSSASPDIWFKHIASAYRLTLRALSASVRHHPTATQNLRRLYRPAFVEAVATMESYIKEATTEKEVSIQEWNERLNRTLLLLHSSATSAGQPKKLIKNLSLLTDAYHTRAYLDESALKRKAGQWNPENIVKPSKLKNKTSANLARDEVHLNAWSSLGELALAAAGDLRIIVSRQERVKHSFSRVTMPRRIVGAKERRLFRFVGKSAVRPKELKVALLVHVQPESSLTLF
ncbi:hypothetical protein CPB86DRAFT_865200 [Serendipita vermifera]|nr:hypothetical protein CPB86DRAFT_865200 [Serendipita vermifera]